MKLGSFLLGGVTGATLAYMLDPDRGRRRRVMARERLLATFRRGGRRTRRLGRKLGADAYGVKQKVTHLRPEDSGPTDDVTLTRRVESELFRDPHLPKGRINISAQKGIVVLRGELEHPDQIADLEARVRKVHGVHAVENYLHLQGTPAPNKAEALQTEGTWSPAGAR